MAPGNLLLSPPRNTPVVFQESSIFVQRWISWSEQGVGRRLQCRPVYDTCLCFSCQKFCSLLDCSRSGLPCLWRVTQFVYCLLQKIKTASSLPLVEQWEEYIVPNHPRFPGIDDKNFFAGNRVTAALGKVGSKYLQTEFRRDARRFLEDFVNCVLSTVASRSVIGQGLSCFCPAIVVGGDDVVPLQLFNKLLDGLLEKGWTRGSEVEACRAEYQFFVQEQRQLERSSKRSRPDVGDVMFCFGQAGFRARRHLYKICIVANQACGFHPFETSHPSMRLCVSGVPVDDACDPWASSAR